MAASALRVSSAAKVLDCSVATIWNIINRNELAALRQGGLTLVVQDWGPDTPPREGRAPSIAELLREKVIASEDKRRMPKGVHHGRPRRRPSAE
jgi:hypothetical protein